MYSIVQVRDDVIWVSHIENAPDLIPMIIGMAPGEIIRLCVDGFHGSWEKLPNQNTGHALRPIGEAKVHWQSVYKALYRTCTSIDLSSVERIAA